MSVALSAGTSSPPPGVGLSRASSPPPGSPFGGDSSDEDAGGEKHLSEYLHMIGLAPDPEEERKEARKRKKLGLPPVVKPVKKAYAKERRWRPTPVSVGVEVYATPPGSADAISGRWFHVRVTTQSAEAAAAGMASRAAADAANDDGQGDAMRQGAAAFKAAGKRGKVASSVKQWESYKAYLERQAHRKAVRRSPVSFHVVCTEVSSGGGAEPDNVLMLDVGGGPVPLYPREPPTEDDTRAWVRYHLVPVLAIKPLNEPPPPMPPPLEDNPWGEYVDADGNVYYEHYLTGETAWEKPPPPTPLPKPPTPTPGAGSQAGVPEETEALILADLEYRQQQVELERLRQEAYQAVLDAQEDERERAAADRRPHWQSRMFDYASGYGHLNLPYDDWYVDSKGRARLTNPDAYKLMVYGVRPPSPGEAVDDGLDAEIGAEAVSDEGGDDDEGEADAASTTSSSSGVTGSTCSIEVVVVPRPPKEPTPPPSRDSRRPFTGLSLSLSGSRPGTAGSTRGLDVGENPPVVAFTATGAIIDLEAEEKEEGVDYGGALHAFLTGPARLHAHEITMHQLGVRALPDLDLLSTDDLDSMGLSYVERHRLWRHLKAAHEGQWEPPANVGGAQVLALSPGAVASTEEGEEQPVLDAMSPAGVGLSPEVCGGGAYTGAPLTAILSTTDDMLAALGLTHRKATLATGGILTPDDVAAASTQTDSHLKVHCKLTPFEIRKLRLLTAGLRSSRAPRRAVRLSQVDGLPAELFAHSSDESEGGGESKEEKEEEDHDPMLMAVLSSVGVEHHVGGFTNVYIRTIDDLAKQTDADLRLAGLDDKEVKDLRINVDTILRGRRLRDAARAKRDRLAEARLRPRRTWRQRAYLCCTRLPVVGPHCGRCLPTPAHSVRLLHPSPWEQLRQIMRLESPGLKPFFSRGVFYCRMVAVVLAVFTAMVISQASGDLERTSADSAAVHLTYADEPDFVQGVVACVVFVWWQCMVQLYYVLVFKGKINQWNWGHLVEVILEVLVYIFVLATTAIVATRNTNYTLFPDLQATVNFALIFMGSACLIAFPSVAMLVFSAKFTLSGPSFSTYHLQGVPEPRRSIKIYTGDGSPPKGDLDAAVKSDLDGML